MKKIDKKTSEIKVTIEANKEDWVSKQRIARDELTKNLSIKGFRKGNIPADIAKKHISDDQVWSKALPKMLDILVKVAASDVKEDNILSGPSYLIDKISNTELTVTFVYPMYPEIEIGNYMDHGIKYEENKIEEEAIEKDINTIKNRHAILKTKDSAIVKGDIANFDFEGLKDGTPFDGGTAKGYELEIGSGQFIPGFEDQMIGMKKDEEKDINVTFPEDYHSEELKGKPVVFKVKINEVKVKEVPAMDEKLIKELNIPDVTNEKELRSYIRGVLETQEKQTSREKFMKKFLDKKFEEIKIVIPTQLISQDMNLQRRQIEDNLKKQGMDFKAWLKATNTTLEQFTSNVKKQSEERLKTAFIFSEIARLEKIELTDKDYEEQYEKLSKVYGQTTDALKGTITKEQLQVPMTNERIVSLLIGKK